MTGFPCLFWSIFSKELDFATLHFLLQLVGGSTSILYVVFFFFYEWLLHFSRKIYLTFLRYHLWYQSFFYHYIFLWLRFLSASHFFDAVQEELALSIPGTYIRPWVYLVGDFIWNSGLYPHCVKNENISEGNPPTHKIMWTARVRTQVHYSSSWLPFFLRLKGYGHNFIQKLFSCVQRFSKTFLIVYQNLSMSVIVTSEIQSS